jgi:hypothetical protein
LRDQIRQSRESGDKAAAASLRGELRSTHSENVAQKQSDMSELKDAPPRSAQRQQGPRGSTGPTVTMDGTLDAVEKRRGGKRRKAPQPESERMLIDRQQPYGIFDGTWGNVPDCGRPSRSACGAQLRMNAVGFFDRWGRAVCAA